MSLPRAVRIREVGPRDGFQNEPEIVATEDKVRLIDALARNPKTPPDLAVRALDHVPIEALRQMAKGVGVLPHVSQAARKKVLG